MSGPVILGEQAPARAKLAIPKPPGLDEFVMPYIPANVQSNERFLVQEVTGDVYNIAERLRELNSRLRINVLYDRQTKQTAFSITEMTPDGPQLVFRCTRLDARVVEHVRYLLNVPFERRFAEAEKLIDKWEAEAHEDELDGLVEEFGLEMQYDLKRLGFVDGTYNPGSHVRRKFGRG